MKQVRTVEKKGQVMNPQNPDEGNEGNEGAGDD